MSSPHSNHSDSNYPEDKVTHYPKKTIHGRMSHISAKTKALKKKMGELGGRFTKK